MASSVFSEIDLASIRDAVGDAELRTSAEIRVYIDKHVKGDPLDHAAYLFNKLGMSATALRNGVMIYIAYADRTFCIIGDIGIHRHVGDECWKSISDKMSESFRSGLMREGVTNAVKEVGAALANHFPRMNNDINELTDEVQTGF